METDNTRCRPRALLTLVGGVCVHLALGAYYTFGNMTPYIISYLRIKSDGIKNVDSLWISNTGVIPGVFAVILGGVLEKRLGCKLSTAIGCFLYSLGVVVTYFTIKQSLPLVCFSYGFVVQFGSFIAYGIPLQTAARWFPKHPTLVIGLILCGYGGSSLILNQIITSYINPDNISPDLETDDGEKYFTDKDLLDRVPTTFLILAGIYVSLQCMGVILMSEPPVSVEITKVKPDYSNYNSYDGHYESAPILGVHGDKDTLSCYETVNAKQNGESTLKEKSDQQEKEKQKPRLPIKTVLLTMVKNRNSYVVLSLIFFVFSGMQFNITLYKAYGQTFISDDHFLALVGSIAAVFNCACRPLWGFIMDIYGFQVTTKLLSALFVCIMVTIPLTEKLGKAAFLIWICASYGAFCGIFPIGPSTMGKLFGKENMVTNMSCVFFAVTIATLFGGFSGLTLKDTIGWHGLFLMAGCLAAVAFFSSFFFNGKDEDGKEI